MDGDGGFAGEGAAAVFLIFLAIALILVYFGFFKLLRRLYRKRKILVVGPWILIFPSLFWLLINCTGEALISFVVYTPFLWTALLLVRFPIPMIAYFVIAYASLTLAYFLWKRKTIQVLNKGNTES
jgi:hypothetical protein